MQISAEPVSSVLPEVLQTSNTYFKRALPLIRRLTAPKNVLPIDGLAPLGKSLQKFKKSSQSIKMESLRNVTVTSNMRKYLAREESLGKYLSKASTLQEYSLMSHLGKGSFSVVSLAVHRGTNHRFAIKAYSKVDQMENYLFQNLQRQIQHLLQLKHENIVSLFHVISDKRKIFLIMQDAGKSSLASLVRKHLIVPQDIAKKIFKQIVTGVQYIHSQGICHRDLKLENILLDEQNQVKIIDFGFSAKCGHKLQTHCGTPPYMAPQIAAKSPYEGQCADVWSLGVVLYLMLYGKFPFRANNQKQLYRVIQGGKFQMGDQVTQPARQLISRMLKCNLKERANCKSILTSPWLQ